MRKNNTQSLADQVAELSEIDHPIYGHDELVDDVSRPCVDRLGTILRIYDALQALLNRPLRVLDIGCAQGFFSLSLAERGADVLGLDVRDENIAVCRAIAKKHTKFNVQFEVGRIEDVAEHALESQCDLVLGLNVFHHILHEKGREATQGFINSLSESAVLLLVEKVSGEAAERKSEEPYPLFQNCTFVHESGSPSPAPSSVSDLLYAVSNLYWVVGDRAGIIDSWSDDPHAFAKGTHQGSRRYFFSPNEVVKKYRFDHPRGWLNREEFDRETSFYKNVPQGFPAPALQVSACSETEGWVVLERMPGRLLLDLIRDSEEFCRMDVLRSVLEQLVVLESAGFYHNDVRVWNILVQTDGSITLLDAGSISTRQEDCVWPENIFLSFFIFVYELMTGEIAAGDSLRMRNMTPYSLPEPCRHWAVSIWRYPVEEWNFALMLELLDSVETSEVLLNQPLGEWVAAIELALERQAEFIQHLKTQIEAGDKDSLSEALQATERMEKAAEDIKEKTCRVMVDEEALRSRAEEFALEASERAVLSEARSQQNIRLALNESRRAEHLEKRVEQTEKRAELANCEATLAEQQVRIRQMRNERNTDRLKIVELNRTLKEMLTRRHEAQIAAGKSEARAQHLQALLDVTQTRAGSLKEQLAEKTADLASREATLSAQQTHTQRLENEWGVAKKKIDELNREIKETVALRYEAQVATVEAEASIQKLQSELDAAQTHAGLLDERLSEKDVLLANYETTLADERARSQWMENEWNAAKVKVDELNHSSHHWWTVADNFRQQLEEIHSSRCVRWTASFRWVSMQFRRLRNEGLFARLKALVKKILRAFACKVGQFVFRHPRLKERAGIRLRKHPGLKAKIRRFAIENGLTNRSKNVASSVARGADPSIGDLHTDVPKQVFLGDFYEMTGLCSPEPWGCWSDGDAVIFQFEEPLPEQFSLHLTAKAFGPNVGKEFIASVGDSCGGFCMEGEPTRCTVDLINPNGLSTLQIHVPEPTAPADISESDDQRRLGFGLYEMQVGLDGQIVVVDFLGRERHRMSSRAKSIYNDIKRLISEKENDGCA